VGTVAKLTSKNQLTLPVKIVREYPDVRLFDVSVREGEIVLSPLRTYRPSPALLSARRKFRELGLSEKDIAEAVRWSRRRTRAA